MRSDPSNTPSGTQRNPRADGQRTRDTILRAAASLATIEGLEGLSIGNLAAAIGMSKSGLYAHFGTKQELQLATVAEAERIFAEEVMQPALVAPPGRAQLAAVCEAFFSYVERRRLRRRVLLRRDGARDGRSPRTGQRADRRDPARLRRATPVFRGDRDCAA